MVVGISSPNVLLASAVVIRIAGRAIRRVAVIVVDGRISAVDGRVVAGLLREIALLIRGCVQQDDNGGQQYGDLFKIMFNIMTGQKNYLTKTLDLRGSAFSGRRFRCVGLGR